MRSSTEMAQISFADLQTKKCMRFKNFHAKTIIVRVPEVPVEFRVLEGLNLEQLMHEVGSDRLSEGSYEKKLLFSDD